MAILSVAPAVRGAGLDLTTLVAAAGGGDSFANTGKEVFLMKNASAGVITATFTAQISLDGRTLPALAVVVGIGLTVMVGPFATGIYNDTNGLVQVTYSGVTTFTVKPIQVTPV